MRAIAIAALIGIAPFAGAASARFEWEDSGFVDPRSFGYSFEQPSEPSEEEPAEHEPSEQEQVTQRLDARFTTSRLKLGYADNIQFRFIDTDERGPFATGTVDYHRGQHQIGFSATRLWVGSNSVIPRSSYRVSYGFYEINQYDPSCDTGKSEEADERKSTFGSLLSRVVDCVPRSLLDKVHVALATDDALETGRAWQFEWGLDSSGFQDVLGVRTPLLGMSGRAVVRRNDDGSMEYSSHALVRYALFPKKWTDRIAGGRLSSALFAGYGWERIDGHSRLTPFHTRFELSWRIVTNTYVSVRYSPTYRFQARDRQEGLNHGLSVHLNVPIYTDLRLRI